MDTSTNENIETLPARPPIGNRLEHTGDRFRRACELNPDVPTTQEGLGKFFKVSGPTVHGWRNGKLMGMDKAIEIATKLNVSIDWLLTGRGKPRP